LVASRGGRGPAAGRGVCEPGPGPHAGALQLAQPGRGLLLGRPAEGPRSQRVRQPGRGPGAAAALRGAEQWRAAPVPVEVRSEETGRVPPATRGEAGPIGRRVTLQLFLKRTTKQVDEVTPHVTHPRNPPPHGGRGLRNYPRTPFRTPETLWNN